MSLYRAQGGKVNDPGCGRPSYSVPPPAGRKVQYYPMKMNWLVVTLPSTSRPRSLVVTPPASWLA